MLFAYWGSEEIMQDETPSIFTPKGIFLTEEKKKWRLFDPVVDIKLYLELRKGKRLVKANFAPWNIRRSYRREVS